jgi:beta-glucosidase
VTYSSDGKSLYSGDGAADGEHKPDAIIAVIGEMPYAEGMGDRKDLGLNASDMSLVYQAELTGAPVVVVLLSGRPLIIDKALGASAAFIAAWLPGTEGTGVADVLFGDYKPTGKLPHTWPKSMDQVPVHAGDATAKDALFPYGFGLNY